MELRWRNKAEARAWVAKQVAGWTRPCLVALSGDLGAGKTQLVRWFVEALGGEMPSSPTFSIHQRYETPAGSVDHVDLYRLENDADLESTGFWDLFRDDEGGGGMVFVEWADRLPRDVWPREWRRVFVTLARDRDGEKSASGEARLARVEVVEAQ